MHPRAWQDIYVKSCSQPKPRQKGSWVLCVLGSCGGCKDIIKDSEIAKWKEMG